MSREKDISVDRAHFSFEDFDFRTPIKFGGNVVTALTLLNVEVEVADRVGRKALGRGSMPLGNVWSFPSKVLSFDATLGLMKELAARIAMVSASFRDFGHPVEINHRLEPEYFRAAEALERGKKARREDSSPVHDGYRQPLRRGRA